MINKMSKLKKKYWKNNMIISIGSIAIIFIILFFIFIKLDVTDVSADESLKREKVVTSIKIEKGDTLWSIAENFITDEYSDMNEYIEEIKKSNGLVSDTIHDGNYIIVPYYSTGNTTDYVAR